MTIALETVPSRSRRVERFDTVVIGAGQAGLAVGHHLAARDQDFVILSDESRVGDNWRKRWDSLRLFTPARYSGLPGMPFPATPGYLADKDEVGDYLERYAERFDLPVRLNSAVQTTSLWRAGFDIRCPSGSDQNSIIPFSVATTRERASGLKMALTPRVEFVSAGPICRPVSVSRTSVRSWLDMITNQWPSRENST